MIHVFLGDPKPEIRAAEKKRLLNLVSGPRVVLETCDRLEIYAGDGVAPRVVLGHLARVTAGLHSPLLGEKAIQGQVKQAYLGAQAAGTLSSGLHGLFQKALALGRQVRRETRLDWGAVSHAQGVQQILKTQGALVPGARILVIGVNKLTGDILRWLKASGGSQVILANRTLDRARAWAREFGIQAEDLRTLKALLPEAQVVISCTSAPHPVIRGDHTAGMDSRSRWFFDLAAPPDFAPEVRSLPGVRFYDLEAVEAQLAAHRDLRMDEALKAEELILRALDRIYNKGGDHVEPWTAKQPLVPASVG